jgi:hypothetical protein
VRVRGELIEPGPPRAAPVGAGPDHHGHRQLVHMIGKMTQELQRPDIGPVGIIDREQQRDEAVVFLVGAAQRGGQPVQPEHQLLGGRRRPGRGRRAEEAEQPGGQPGKAGEQATPVLGGRRAYGRSEQAGRDAEGDIPLELAPSCVQMAQTVRTPEGVEQRGLAHTGRAGDDRDAAFAPARTPEQGMQNLQLTLAFEEGMDVVGHGRVSSGGIAANRNVLR